jgi:hypothetical protein
MQVIIFAGGMAEAGDFLLNKVRGAYQRRGWTILENEVRHFDQLSKTKTCIAASAL